MRNRSAPGNGSERLFVNGLIYTGDKAFSTASVLAVRDGRICYVGDSPEKGAASLAPDVVPIDLGGHTVIPGIIDSHLHFLVQGRRLSEIDIFLKSREEILEEVAREARRLGPGQWIIGRGWNNELWPDKAWPHKEELDAVAPDNPVALARADAHSLWANSAALRAAGFDRNSPDMAGGEMIRTPDGDLQGILVDAPMFKFWECIPALDDEQRLRAFQLAQEELFSYGITSAGDAWQYAEDYAFLKRAYRAGALRLRLYGMLASIDPRGGSDFRAAVRDDSDNGASVRDEAEQGGRSELEDPIPETGLFGERLSRRAFKVVLDGSLGSRSAWLARDYADRPGHRGSPRYTDEELYALAKPVAERGFQICVHAIGDAATQQAVRLFARLQSAFPACDARHRIEHFQIASPELIEQALALGIVPAMQSVHALADTAMAQCRLDAKALGQSYPWRGILDRGGYIANGSDCPMETVNPFCGIYAAVSRDRYLPSHNKNHASAAMSRQEALRSYTLWAAYAEYAEDRKGSLEAGKLADFVVLDRDIMLCPEEAIKETQALLTVLGGEEVYRNPSWDEGVSR